MSFRNLIHFKGLRHFVASRGMRFVTLGLTLSALMAFLSVSVFAQTPEQRAREFLLSEDFFDAFYGTNYDEPMQFASGSATIDMPFASDKETPRGNFDKPFTWDCSAYLNYQLSLKVDHPEAIGHSTLYFHSKTGWYSLSGQVAHSKNGHCVILFPVNSYMSEGQPVGLDKIDAIRVSLWRGAAVDAKAEILSLRMQRAVIAVLRNGEPGSEGDKYARDMTRLLNPLGGLSEQLDANLATPEALQRYSAVIVPVGGSLTPAATDALCEYVAQGGFVLGFYNIPEKLMKAIGVQSLGFVRCADVDLDLQGITFEQSSRANLAQKGLPLPEKIAQQSWNFFKVTPQTNWRAPGADSRRLGRSARVIANWSTADKTLEYPALILSDSGLYCSHVFTESDPDTKRAFLNMLFSVVCPGVAQQSARAQWRSTLRVGVDPVNNAEQTISANLDNVEKSLKDNGFTLIDVARLLDAERAAEVDALQLSKFQEALLVCKNKLVEVFCASQVAPAGEGRFWWEHSGFGVYAGDWDRTMRELSDAGITGVIPNMLWGGLAYYPSKVLPVDKRVEQYGDQIAQAVAAGKKYGVEVHVWMVCFNASNSSEEFLSQMRSQGRLQVTFNGEPTRWLCPSDPRNRQLQLDALLEVATNYDVDGVHFDYIRFPDGSSCYCDGCKERFATAYHEHTGEELGDFNVAINRAEVREEWNQWRCDQITALVREVHDAVKALRPNVKISAAVFSSYPGTKVTIAQDWGKWIEDGLIDFVCPMDYTADPVAFRSFVQNQKPYIKQGVKFYPGIGMTATGIAMSADEVVLQTKIARELNVDGFTIFNLTKSTADKALPYLKMSVKDEK
ncbi:MAG: family 10 glycosylhydrolase [Planctomycetia bacterium]|nr:family 10 glycosylhydrolase [Planctomycetia bacterium]